MKFLSWLTIIAVCAVFISCGEKKDNEAERRAQIEKEVQARLEAEHRLQEDHRVKKEKAEQAEREKALAAQEAAAANEPDATATPRVVVSDRESASEEQAQSYDTFYRKLEPYGTWRESADYGYVWQPRAAEGRDWRPYTDGRWAYTDAGWTWVSEEPFGWATYHYGRWTRLRDVGWVWVPGDEWAPAWVSWRTSDQHVGWAPLPPEARFEKRTGIKRWADSYYDIDAGEYVFVPNESIGDENVQRDVIPAEQNVTIVNETTNVTNITYNNTMIVNEGPNYEQLRARSRRPVDRLRLQREYNVEQEQNPRATVSGETLQVIAPLFAPRATEKPRTGGPPIQRNAVEHVALGGDQAELERARRKMKAEATPPSDAPPKKFERRVIAEATPAPEASATLAPTATPTPRPIVTSTAAPSVTPRTTISPRPTPTARPSASPTMTPRAATTASPVRATPRPTSPRASATPGETPRRAQTSPSPRASATPAETPRRARTSPSPTPPLPADMTEGTPSGIELTPPPKPAPKKPIPSKASPSPTPPQP